MPKIPGATFTGWPPEAIAFYDGLAADNSRSYWQASKATYEQSVLAPMRAFAELVVEEFGPLQVFRPYRDVRFSKDKTPYKTHCGAVTEGEGGELYYVQLGADGLLVGSGYHHLAADQLERFRAAIDDDTTGTALVEVCDQLAAAGYTFSAASELKTAPRGFPRDHPRVTLLRRKGLTALRSFRPAPWMSTGRAATRIIETWRGVAPLNGWLNTHVGPSTLEPEGDRWR